jgi:hypothetical protein
MNSKALTNSIIFEASKVSNGSAILTFSSRCNFNEATISWVVVDSTLLAG